MHAIPQLIVSTLLLGMYLAFGAFAFLHFDPYLTLIVSLPLYFAVGWVSYRAVMKPIVHASHNVQVFTTVGLSIALQNVALVLWTADARFLRTDYYAIVVRVFGAAFNLAQIVAFAAAVTLTATLFAFMRWSYTGKVMRATAQDRQASALMGIDTDKIYALTWAVGITCVGAAGVLLSPIYPVYPTAGLQFVLIAFVAVVLGGLGDMAGALIASLIVAAA